VGQPVAFEVLLGLLQGQKQIVMETLVVLPGSLLENQLIKRFEFENRKLIVMGVISSNHIHLRHHNRYKVKNQHFYFKPETSFKLQAQDIIVVLGRKYSIEHFQDQIKKSSLGH
jgi:voltage-gated potassium channel